MNFNWKKVLSAGVYTFSVLLLLAVAGHSQTTITAAGNPSNSATFPVEVGSVNLGNGNLHIEIPIANIPQRGDLSLPVMLV